MNPNIGQVINFYTHVRAFDSKWLIVNTILNVNCGIILNVPAILPVTEGSTFRIIDLQVHAKYSILDFFTTSNLGCPIL